MVFESVDHVIIAVADLDAATASYRTLLGRAPSWRGVHPAFGTQNTLFKLDNTYIELLAAQPGPATPLTALLRDALGDRPERPFGLALGTADLKAAIGIMRGRGVRVSDPADGEGVDERSGRRRTWRSASVDPTTAGGLRLLLIQHTSPPRALPHAMPVADDATICVGVDHVVIFAGDLNATLQMWTGAFRIAERWRRDFPERGTRNVGLVLGDITIECVGQLEPMAGSIADRFWGVAYRVPDCERTAARVRAAGIAVDNPRTGLAPHTRVSTVRWPGTPTLVLEKLSRPSGE